MSHGAPSLRWEYHIHEDYRGVRHIVDRQPPESFPRLNQHTSSGDKSHKRSVEPSWTKADEAARLSVLLQTNWTKWNAWYATVFNELTALTAAMDDLGMDVTEQLCGARCDFNSC